MTNPFVSLEQAAVHMHGGVGAESLLQAGQAWGVVAQKLVVAAEEMVLVIAWCGGQYWQGPAAQQMREAINVVAQGLKDNAVVAGKIETAATAVVAAFNKARAVTPTPQKVGDNRQARALLVAADGLRLHQSEIAALDEAYEVMWLESLVAHDRYYQDTSHALKWGEQPWWSPRQQSEKAPTTVGDHLSIPDAPGQLTQHDDMAAWARLYALDHAIQTVKLQEVCDQYGTYAQMWKSFADHYGNPTAELYSKLAQQRRELAQLYRDLPLGQADIPALAQKYVDIATTSEQAEQHLQKMSEAYPAIDRTRPYSQKIGSSSSSRYEQAVYHLDGRSLPYDHNLDFGNPNLDRYIDGIQDSFKQIHANASKPSIGDLHRGDDESYVHQAGTCDVELAELGDGNVHYCTTSTTRLASLSDTYARDSTYAGEYISGYVGDQAKEANDAWRVVQQEHARSIVGHAHDFFVFLQKAARQDAQATTLAGSST